MISRQKQYFADSLKKMIYVIGVAKIIVFKQLINWKNRLLCHYFHDNGVVKTLCDNAHFNFFKYFIDKNSKELRLF